MVSVASWVTLFANSSTGEVTGSRASPPSMVLLCALNCSRAALRWAKGRLAVRVRPYALHWLEEHAKAQCAPEGHGRKRDREAFEADFGMEKK